ncbi:Hypothetical_protein [Hexamita inflata]|uniref:Hypothetical_protein n=1 Tax=Hexamita inflata TaxID=28002 RepID=A0AA86NGJ4_9EUKA|nr:Hypothetical protein HINF_LOCUS6908 [Hexamita inflata]CAI9919265.1 Hypothetical protein HINF_LOCUS6910 [Hexamita inflata]
MKRCITQPHIHSVINIQQFYRGISISLAVVGILVRKLIQAIILLLCTQLRKTLELITILGQLITLRRYLQGQLFLCNDVKNTNELVLAQSHCKQHIISIYDARRGVAAELSVC